MAVLRHIRIPDLQRLFPLRPGFLSVPALFIRCKTTAAAVEICHTADFIRFQYLLHGRHDAIHPGKTDIRLFGLRSRFFAHKSGIRGHTQIIVLCRIQRIRVAVIVCDSIVAESRQIQSFRHRNTEGFHGNRLTIRCFCHTRLNNRPAGGGGFGLHTGPRRTESPAFKVMGIRDDVVRQCGSLIHKGINTDNQRQVCRIFQFLFHHLTHSRNTVQRVGHIGDPGFQLVRISLKRGAELFCQLTGCQRIPRCFGRIRVLTGRHFVFVLIGLFIN